MSIKKRIEDELNISIDLINLIEKYSSRYYSRFLIPKKNGEFRRIYHPSPILKTLQYWIVENIFSYMPISNFATAYQKGSSIKKNAYLHKDCRHLLHLDIKNFFESINEKHLINLLDVNKDKLVIGSLSKEDINFINNVCLYEGHLTIGSVCSPIISNCVMFEFDNEINNKLSLNGITYSRYADDMLFSSSTYIDDGVVDIVRNELNRYGFKLNENKTSFMSPKDRRIATGLIIDRGKVTVGLSRKKQIKKMIYKKLKYNEGDSKRILGYMFFIKDIEPEFFNKLILKYSDYGNIIEILNNLDRNSKNEGNTYEAQVATTKDTE